ncbi:MAG: glycosyltransferase family 2 protein, partial [Candidatus Marinimicrobia bacterium CG_4_9_14_3_um_filter_48_9]
MDHLVSIIVPVYNAETSLETCLSSVLQQTHGQFELIVVNDGSRDDSQKIVDSYVKQDQRVKSFIIRNQGPSIARNVGIDVAQGQSIFFLDADDSLEMNALELLVKAQ